MLFPIVAEFVIGTNSLPKKKLWYVTRRIGLKPILKGITLVKLFVYAKFRESPDKSIIIAGKKLGRKEIAIAKHIPAYKSSILV